MSLRSQPLGSVVNPELFSALVAGGSARKSASPAESSNAKSIARSEPLCNLVNPESISTLVQGGSAQAGPRRLAAVPNKKAPAEAGALYFICQKLEL